MVTATAVKRQVKPAVGGTPGQVQTLKQSDKVTGTDIPIESTTTVAPPAEVEAPAPNPVEQMFKQPATATEEAPPAPERETAVSRPTETKVTRYESMSGGALQGDFSKEDIRFPSLKIVQGSGPLSALFPLGTLVYADEELLPAPHPQKPDPKHTFRFVPITLRKRYRENLANEQVQAGQMPQIVDTVEEVENLGGTTQWIGRERPSWSPTATCLLLLEQPEGVLHPAFTLELAGKAYAPAVYYATGGSYRDAAVHLFNAALTTLLVPVLNEDGTPKLDGKRPVRRSMLHRNFWTWQVAKKQAGDFSVFRPILRLTNVQTPEEIRQFIEQISSSDKVKVDADGGE